MDSVKETGTAPEHGLILLNHLLTITIRPFVVGVAPAFILKLSKVASAVDTARITLLELGR